MVTIGPAVASAHWFGPEFGTGLKAAVEVLSTVFLLPLAVLCFASSVVGDGLFVALGETLVIVCDSVRSANGQIDARANAYALGGRGQTGAIALKLGLIASEIAQVFISPTVRCADRGDIADAIDAFLDWPAIATSLKGALNFGTPQLTLIDVIFAVNSAHWLIDKSAKALGRAVKKALEDGAGAVHNAAVFISDVIRSADVLLGVGAFAHEVGTGLVVEVVAGSHLDGDGAVTFGSAKVCVSNTFV